MPPDQIALNTAITIAVIAIATAALTYAIHRFTTTRRNRARLRRIEELRAYALTSAEQGHLHGDPEASLHALYAILIDDPAIAIPTLHPRKTPNATHQNCKPPARLVAGRIGAAT